MTARDAWRATKRLPFGRELLAWGKQAIIWVLEPRAGARVTPTPADRGCADG